MKITPLKTAFLSKYPPKTSNTTFPIILSAVLIINTKCVVFVYPSQCSKCIQWRSSCQYYTVYTIHTHECWSWRADVLQISGSSELFENDLQVCFISVGAKICKTTALQDQRCQYTFRQRASELSKSSPLLLPQPMPLPSIHHVQRAEGYNCPESRLTERN